MGMPSRIRYIAFLLLLAIVIIGVTSQSVRWLVTFVILAVLFGAIAR